MDRFDAMQAFARVVETGSFTKAAETLLLSKPTVTQLEVRFTVGESPGCRFRSCLPSRNARLRGLGPNP